jgi:large subunit ribosomal protein L13
MKYTLDAQGKKIGRVASEAAKMLMGKQTTEYARNIAPNIQVEIVNAAKVSIALSKHKEELKASYSGYPSGIKTPTIGLILENKGVKELFRRAVSGMLPRNKLRAKMIKNLIITE